MRYLHHPLLFLVCTAGCNGQSSKDDTGLLCWADLVFSEIMYDPSALSDSEGEYFELYNTGDSVCSLRGLTITRESNSHEVGEDVGAPAGGYVVLAKHEASIAVFDVDYIYGGGVSLTDETTLCIEDDVGNTLDCVSYGDSSWTMPAAGQSMSLHPEYLDAGDNDMPGYWCLSEDDIGNGDLGSPGADGPSCEPPVAPPSCPESAELVISEIMPDPETGESEPAGEYLEIYNAGSAAVPLACVLIYDDGVAVGDGTLVSCSGELAPGGYQLFANNAELVAGIAGLDVDEVCDHSLGLSNSGEAWAVGFIDVDEVETVLDTVDCATLACPYDGGVSMNLSADSLDTSDNDDMDSWCESTTAFGSEHIQYGTPGAANEACPEPVTLFEGDAFITELLPRPASSVGSTHGEYIEAYNVSGQLIPLADLNLVDGGSAKTLSCSEAGWADGDLLVIARDTEPLTNGGFSADCQASFVASDDGDSFGLLYTQPDGSELLLDELVYDDTWPFDQGYAMELLSGGCFSAAGNDGPGCWTQATDVFGDAGQYGTPGSVP